MEERRRKGLPLIMTFAMFGAFLLGIADYSFSDSWVNGTNYIYPNSSWSKNVNVTGNFTVQGQNVCLQNGTYCPASSSSSGGWYNNSLITNTSLNVLIGPSIGSPATLTIATPSNINPTLRLGNNGRYTQFTQDNQSGTLTLDLFSVGTNNTVFRLFRSSISSSNTFDIFKGNGSGTINTRFGGNVNSYIAADNSNVGIGTTTPKQKLDVNGSANISTNLSVVGVLSINNPTPADGYALNVGGTIAMSGNAFYARGETLTFYIITNKNFSFRDGAGTNTANVGIGILNDVPTQRLDVNGSINTTGFLYMNANNNINCSRSIAGAIYYNSTTNKHYGCNSTAWNALY